MQQCAKYKYYNLYLGCSEREDFFCCICKFPEPMLKVGLNAHTRRSYKLAVEHFSFLFSKLRFKYIILLSIYIYIILVVREYVTIIEFEYSSIHGCDVVVTVQIIITTKPKVQKRI